MQFSVDNLNLVDDSLMHFLFSLSGGEKGRFLKAYSKANRPSKLPNCIRGQRGSALAQAQFFMPRSSGLTWLEAIGC